MLHEHDITESALACGLADKALHHYNKAMPWGAKTRKTADYLYVLRMNSRGVCKLWMLQRNGAKEAVMYFSYNENIGALTSEEADRTHITILHNGALQCLCDAKQQMLTNRLHTG